MSDKAEEMPELEPDDMETAVRGENNDSAGSREALETELSVVKEQMLRALAEAENTRRRALKEREDAMRYSVTSFARDLLTTLDNFDRAIKSIPEDLRNGDARVQNLVAGLDAVEREMLGTFDKHGIKKVHPLGEPFNPHFHEVMVEMPGTGQPAGTVVQVFDSGYVIHDRLLRPARVGVAKDSAELPKNIDEKV
ncbi:MAG: nucleotide exchange factor GrpE [Alphaproteobacteria bacterium]|nr:nucleotide exchange factor GrpE [Alphaproteobacteria bacterium]